MIPFEKYPKSRQLRSQIYALLFFAPLQIIAFPQREGKAASALIFLRVRVTGATKEWVAGWVFFTPWKYCGITVEIKWSLRFVSHSLLSILSSTLHPIKADVLRRPTSLASSASFSCPSTPSYFLKSCSSSALTPRTCYSDSRFLPGPLNLACLDICIL